METARRALGELWDGDYGLKAVHAVRRLVRADAALTYQTPDAEGRLPVVHTLGGEARSWSAIRNHRELGRFQSLWLLARSARQLDGRTIDLQQITDASKVRAEYRETVLAPNGMWHQLRTALYREDGSLLGYASGFRSRAGGGFIERDHACLAAVDLDGRSLHVVLERRDALPRLPTRLKAVAELLVIGCSDREIARRLGVAHASARVYVARVRARLGVHRRLDAARALGERADVYIG